MAPFLTLVSSYDDLNRLTDSQTGVLNAAGTGLYGAPYRSPRTQDMEYQYFGSTYGRFQLYQVSGGTWTVKGSPVPVAASTSYTVIVEGNSFIGASGGMVSFPQPIAAGRVGLIASRADIVFDAFAVSRIDWPTLAAPTWQVYRGDFNLAGGSATLGPQGLAVREGTYNRDYDIELRLQSNYGGVALRVQDSLNYYYLTTTTLVSSQPWRNIRKAHYEPPSGGLIGTILGRCGTIPTQATVPRKPRFQGPRGGLGRLGR